MAGTDTSQCSATLGSYIGYTATGLQLVWPPSSCYHLGGGAGDGVWRKLISTIRISDLDIGHYNRFGRHMCQVVTHM